MITMEMAYKNVINALRLDAETQHLLLRPFPAIDKEKLIVDIKKLGSRISVKYRCCRTTAQNRNLESHVQQVKLTSALPF